MTEIASRAFAPGLLGMSARVRPSSRSNSSADADAATSFRLEGIVQQALFAQPDLMARFPQALAFIKAQLANAE